jgi:glycosyltransferase involved in cell wall biosynthesis
VASIAAQTVRALETIVVVDHNPALAARTRARWPELLVAENLDEPGVSAARNAGIECASGAVVAFIDDDAIAAPDWVESMLRVYRDQTVMAVGGAIEPLWQLGQPGWFPDEFGWVVGCGYTGLPESPTEVRNVIGTNMSFRRELFAGIGGFDSGIGQVGARSGRRCDETELCVRAGQRWPDRKIVHDPRVRVAHRVPETRSRLRYFVSRCYWEGKSKALISERVGQRAALSSELRYATRILPAGVVHGLRDAILGDRSGLGRAAAIVTGLTATSAGFLAARLGGPPARLLTRT